jgi:hypothetical protein
MREIGFDQHLHGTASHTIRKVFDLLMNSSTMMMMLMMIMTIITSWVVMIASLVINIIDEQVDQ